MKEKTKEWKRPAKEYFTVFCLCLAFSCCIYYLLISNGLVNGDDGLWEYDYYKGGKWVLTLGRWFIPYLDRLRFGFSTEPITSVITLALYSLGLIIMLRLLGMEAKRRSGLLVCALFMSSVVICVSLSYRYTSLNYGVAFLLNVAAVWVIVNLKKCIGILGGAF